MKQSDDINPVEVARGIHWIGFADYDAGLANNPYLLVDGDEAVLFDPGPGHPIIRDIIMYKIRQIINPEQIKFIVAHHQDPDICGILPYIENLLNDDVVICTTPRSSLFISYYGISKKILPIGDRDILELKSGRRLQFFHIPHIHSPGNMATYDFGTKSLFTSDIFSVLTTDWSLYADERYLTWARDFLERYTACKAPLDYAYQVFSELDIKNILPQHGGVIIDDTKRFLEILRKAEPGKTLRLIKNKPGKADLDSIVVKGKDLLSNLLKKNVSAQTIEDLLKIARQTGPSAVIRIIELIGEESARLELANPLTFGRVHKSNQLENLKLPGLVTSFQTRSGEMKQHTLEKKVFNMEEMVLSGLLSTKIQAAIMLIDIKEFNIWAEKKNSVQILSELNRSFDSISKIVYHNGGRINKILGGSILAYFPKSRIKGLVKVITSLHKEIDDKDLLPIGIGADFGEVLIGDVGRESTLDYTLIGPVIGTTINLSDYARKGEVVFTRELFDVIDPKHREIIEDLFVIEETKLIIRKQNKERNVVKFLFSDFQ